MRDTFSKSRVALHACSGLSSWCAAAVTLAGFAALSSHGLRAATISQDLVFSTSGQSIWQNGAGGSVSYNGFVGPSWNNVGGSIGGVTCGFFGCGGAEASLNTSGSAGVAYSLQATTGQLSITFPEQVSFTTPDPGTVAAGNAFTITANVTPATTITLQSGGVARPSLITAGPSVQASLTLQAQANLTASARACVFGCLSGSASVNPSFSQSLLTLDSNASTLTVLGSPVTQSGGGFSFTSPGGYVTVNARVPALNTDSAQGGTVGATNLTSTVRANALGVNVSLDKILSTLAGLPPLNGNIGPIGYGLLTATAGATLDVQQSFNFMPNLSAALNFTVPESLQYPNGRFGPAASSANVTLQPGTNTFTFQGDKVPSLGVSPVFTLNNTTSNNTALVLAGNIAVQAGSLNAFGQTLGPVFSTTQDLGSLPPISVYQNNFAVNIPSITATPFDIAFGAAAPAALALAAPALAFGAPAGSAATDFLLVASATGDTQIYEVTDLTGLLSNNLLLIGSGASLDGSCAAADGLGSGGAGDVELVCSPDGSPIGPYLLKLNGVSYYGTEAAQTPSADGTAVFYDGASAVTPIDTNVIVDSTPAGDLLELAALGYVPGADDPDTPDLGAPLPIDPIPITDVPEPRSIAMFGLALAGLLGLTARRSGQPRAW